MIFHNFQELFDSLEGQYRKKTAVAWANENHTLEAVLMAYNKGMIEPILIGDPADLKKRLRELAYPFSPSIIPAGSAEQAVIMAVELARDGKVDLILKGLVDTAVIMRQIVRKENGLSSGGVLSHLTLVELPSYHKLLGVTDCALLTYPSLDQKKEAIRNALDFYHSIGQDEVKVAVLAAVEKVNPKMQETLDAAALKEAYQNGELPGGIVEGPISYDLAMVKEAAEVKGYNSPVAGDADLLVVPNITAGNILIKSLTYTAGGYTAAIILGAKVPVVITSRSSPIRSKYTSLCLAAAMRQNRS